MRTPWMASLFKALLNLPIWYAKRLFLISVHQMQKFYKKSDRFGFLLGIPSGNKISLFLRPVVIPKNALQTPIGRLKFHLWIGLAP